MAHYTDDKLIIDKLKKGDVLSFDNLFRKYNKKVYFFALSYLKNSEEAEDVVQDVFLNLWRYRDHISEYFDFSSYLFRITYNVTCKRFWKQASDRKHLEEVIKNVSIDDDSTNLDIEYQNLLETTDRLIEKLPVRQKDILLLSLKEHLDSTQIARRLNISKKTVENYLAMAKASLRRSLADGRLLSVLFVWLFLNK